MFEHFRLFQQRKKSPVSFIEGYSRAYTTTVISFHWVDSNSNNNNGQSKFFLFSPLHWNSMVVFLSSLTPFSLLSDFISHAHKIKKRRKRKAKFNKKPIGRLKTQKEEIKTYQNQWAFLIWTMWPFFSTHTQQKNCSPFSQRDTCSSLLLHRCA